MSEEIRRNKNCISCKKKFTAVLKKGIFGWPERPSVFKKSSIAKCDHCKEIENKEREAAIENINYCHYLGWTHEEIKNHFVENPPYKGQKLIIADKRFLNYDEIRFILVEVEDPDFGKFHKIRISGAEDDKGSSLFQRSGKSSSAPTGQVYLLPYNEVIATAIKTKSKWDKFNVEELMEILNLK